MKRPSYTPDFMKFWFAYPQLKRIVNGKVKWKRVGKAEAAIVWEYMTAEDKAHAMYAVQFEERGDYNLEAAHWLSKRRYDDIDMPEEEVHHLPEELTTNVFKTVRHHHIDLNERRNQEMRKLKGESDG